MLSKNTRAMLGKPLIEHTINQAKSAHIFRTIAVSSDSDEILGISADSGVDHLIPRPDVLATDESSKLPAIRHCAEQVEQLSGLSFDLFVDLDATSPLRLVSDIINVISMLLETGADNIITGTRSRRSPYFNMVELNEKNCVELCKKPEFDIKRRQDSPACYDLNASIYAWTREAFFSGPEVITSNTRLYAMPPERSVDIDSELDWKIVELLMAEYQIMKGHEH